VVTSVMLVTRRVPSLKRAACTIRSTARGDLLADGVTNCMLELASVTITSRREITSRGELAWIVVIEPSWPVFIACSMSSASSPRHSPTTMRSGRMRRR
jgi:hypothetical protein